MSDLPSISNGLLSVSCTDEGKGLTVSDNLRAMDWLLDDRTSIARLKGEAGDVILTPIEAVSTGEDSLSVILSGRDARVTVSYHLTPGYIKVVLELEEDSPLVMAALPGSFTPVSGTVAYALPIMQGMLWDGQGSPFEDWRPEASHTGFTMPFIGYMGDRGALLLTAEDQDDIVWWMGKDSTGRTWAANIQKESLESLCGTRSIRLCATGSDITSVAKAYRKKVVGQGRFRTWDEKIAERPALEGLFGSLMCFIGYCQDDTDYVGNCRKLKDFGFDRAMIYPYTFNTYHTDIRMGGVPAISLSEGDVDSIKAMGYDIAPWSWINEALDDGSDTIQGMLRRRSDGSPIPHWAIDDQQWYLVCSSFLESVEDRAVKGSIAQATWDHFDVLACASIGECFALDHTRHAGYPLSRTADREWIKRALLAGRGKERKVSSENFNDAYSKELDIASVKAWPRYGPEWRFKPIPLTMLVYHDSIIHSWWEIHNYNNPHHNRAFGDFFEYGGGDAKLMASMDALMGCPPDVFPFGAQYGYTGNGKESYLYRFRFEDPGVQEALGEALPVARLHKRIGKLEMVHFAFLSEDLSVQESAFVDGTRVIANFGDAPADIGNGIVLAPKGWITE